MDEGCIFQGIFLIILSLLVLDVCQGFRVLGSFKPVHRLARSHGKFPELPNKKASISHDKQSRTTVKQPIEFLATIEDCGNYLYTETKYLFNKVKLNLKENKWNLTRS